MHQSPSHGPAPVRPSSRPRTRPAALAAALALAGGTVGAAALPAALVPALGAGIALPAAAVAGAPAAHAMPAESVDLADGAGIIDRAQLERDLAEVEFREPTRVGVFTERGPDIRGLDEDRKTEAFNGRVLEFARTQRPEWISPDGQKWADGLVIVALDPENRILGIYQGEDRRLSTDQQASVREDAIESARAARWTDAVVDMVDSAADRIGRQWYEDPVVWLAGGTTAVSAGGILWGFNAMRRRRRRSAEGELEAARTHLTSVTMDYEATEVNASTVPLGVPYGARLIERFRGFQQASLDATARLQRLDAVPRKARHKDDFLEEAAGLRQDVAELDALDDAIAAANTFLNRLPGWEDAWDLQVRPLREDLAHVRTLKDRLEDTKGAEAALQSLASFRTEAEGKIEDLGARLAEQRITPQAALDELDALRRRLTELVQQLAEAAIGAQGDDEERRLMREGLERERERARPAQGSILDASGGWQTYWMLSAFDAGHSAGSESVHAHQASESSSSGTGYGSPGGSFSGSGSSGSF